MRRYFLILSLAVISLLFSQCRKEVITENGTSPVNGTFTLTANIDNGGSRTDITAAGQITWKSGDKIYIANSTGIVGSLSYSEGSNFTGNALVDGNYYFYYLGSKDRSSLLGNNTTSIAITEFATQAGTLADITQNHHLMKGEGTVSNNSATVTMTSMISIAYFDISGFKGGTVKLYGTNIYKGMTLNLTAGTFATEGYSASDETSAITIGGTGTAGAYVAFVPTNGATLTFKGTGTDDYTETMAGPYKFSENKFYTQGGSPIAVKTRPEGSLPGRFSVSADKKIRFSQGNLTCIPSTLVWSFHANQWDRCHATDCDVSDEYNSTYTGKIDLFGWGTSGQSTGATHWKPWSTSENNPDYYPGGAYTNNLTYENKADWGYNAISNGGNTAELWRTLTNAEWAYLIGESGKSSERIGAIDGVSKSAMEMRAPGNVNGVGGLIILPDVFTTPSDMSTFFTSGDDVNWDTYNNFSSVDWSKMESAGAVFLPAAGGRYGASVSNVGTIGYYWSSSYYRESYAYVMYFYSDYVDPSGSSGRPVGRSVRLVSDY